MPASFLAPGATIRAMTWPVWLILALCVLPELLFLAAWVVQPAAAPGLRAGVAALLAFWPVLLDGWQPDFAAQPATMFLTYGFLHTGPMHLLVNMVSLAAFAPPVAAVTGPARFLGLYGVLLVAGAAGYALWPAGDIPMVGASGALFGLVGMLLAWDLAFRRRTGRDLRPVGRVLVMLVILNGALWLAVGETVAWQTHLAGFLAGGLCALAVRPSRRR